MHKYRSKGMPSARYLFAKYVWAQLGKRISGYLKQVQKMQKNEYLCLIFMNERDMLAYRKIAGLKVACT